MADTWTAARARIAATKRHHPDADVSDDLRTLAALRLEEHIKRVVDAAPALTSEQLDRLRTLLVPASGRGDAA